MYRTATQNNIKAMHGSNGEGYTTSVEGVFAAGDCRRGQSLVVWAINEGQRAADAVNRYLLESRAKQALSAIRDGLSPSLTPFPSFSLSLSLPLPLPLPHVIRGRTGCACVRNAVLYVRTLCVSATQTL